MNYYEDMTLEDLYDIAIALYDKENYEEAIEYFEKYLEFDADNIAILYILGVSYLHCDNYKKAIETANKMLILDTEGELGYLVIASFFVKIKLYKEAIKYFEICIKLHIIDNHSLEFLIYLYIHSFEYEKIQELQETYNIKKSLLNESNKKYNELQNVLKTINSNKIKKFKKPKKYIETKEDLENKLTILNIEDDNTESIIKIIEILESYRFISTDGKVLLDLGQTYILINHYKKATLIANLLLQNNQKENGYFLLANIFKELEKHQKTKIYIDKTLEYGEKYLEEINVLLFLHYWKIFEYEKAVEIYNKLNEENKKDMQSITEVMINSLKIKKDMQDIFGTF